MPQVIKMNDRNLMRTIEIAIQLGKWVIIDSVQQLEPAFDAYLIPIIVRSHRASKGIKIGDKIVQYNEQFKLILASNLANPDYSPEVFIKTIVINFCLTKVGLEE